MSTDASRVVCALLHARRKWCITIAEGSFGLQPREQDMDW
jgi:hypothetical protein